MRGYKFKDFGQIFLLLQIKYVHITDNYDPIKVLIFNHTLPSFNKMIFTKNIDDFIKFIDLKRHNFIKIKYISFIYSLLLLQMCNM